MNCPMGAAVNHPTPRKEPATLETAKSKEKPWKREKIGKSKQEGFDFLNFCQQHEFQIIHR